MKVEFFTKVLTVLVLALSVTACNNNQPVAESKNNTPSTQEITFTCEVKSGVPTTIAATPRGKIPIIRWVSNYFTKSGYDPQSRCENVTNRFQTYYNQGIINYITAGTENNQEVICVSSTDGGACTGTLFTLKPGEKAARVIQGLFNVAFKAGKPLNESSSSKPSPWMNGKYVDMKKFFALAPVEGN